jgi:two-component system nitrogen regulation response regulator GlnG
MTAEDIWVVDDDKSIRWVLDKALNRTGMNVTTFASANDALHALQSHRPEVLISDIRMPGMDGFSFLKKMQEDYSEIPVIIMTAHSDLDSTVSAYQGGAFEYLAKPFDINEVVELAKRACEQYRSKTAYKEDQSSLKKKAIIGSSIAIQNVFRTIGRLSKSSISVLVTGESGTGKELIAKALHAHSPRVKQTFIAINTAAIPKDLLESELFGHEKGAFTGAHTLRKGRFEQANGGTLFLDEIGDMPAELQTRLLRVLADGEFYRVGGRLPIKVDVRIIAATHQNLERHVEKGLFREDLYHRLNVIHIHSPALRARTEDIPELLQHFLKKSALELQVESKTATPNVIQYMQQLKWPGNIRQLENTARWLTVMASSREIQIEDLPPELLNAEKQVKNVNWEEALSQYAKHCLDNGQNDLLTKLTPIYEKIMINAALEKSAGKKINAAELLGLGRNTLTRKIKELQIDQHK